MVIQVEISYVSCHCSVFYKKQKIQLSFLWFSYSSWGTLEDDVCAFLGAVNECLDGLRWGGSPLKKNLKGLFSAFCVTSHSRCSSCRPSHFSDRSSSALCPGWCKGKTGGSLLPPLQLRLNVVFLHKYLFSFPSSHFNLIEWYKIKWNYYKVIFFKWWFSFSPEWFIN